MKWKKRSHFQGDKQSMHNKKYKWTFFLQCAAFNWIEIAKMEKTVIKIERKSNFPCKTISSELFFINYMARYDTKFRTLMSRKMIQTIERGELLHNYKHHLTNKRLSYFLPLRINNAWKTPHLFFNSSWERFAFNNWLSKWWEFIFHKFACCS